MAIGKNLPRVLGNSVVLHISHIPQQNIGYVLNPRTVYFHHVPSTWSIEARAIMNLETLKPWRVMYKYLWKKWRLFVIFRYLNSYWKSIHHQCSTKKFIYPPRFYWTVGNLVQVTIISFWLVEPSRPIERLRYVVICTKIRDLTQLVSNCCINASCLLSSKARISNPGGLWLSTLPLGHGIFTSELGRNFLFLRNLKARPGIRDLRLSNQAALTTVPGPPGDAMLWIVCTDHRI